MVLAFSAQTDCPKEKGGKAETRWCEVLSLLLKLENKGCSSSKSAFLGVLTQMWGAPVVCMVGTA